MKWQSLTLILIVFMIFVIGTLPSVSSADFDNRKHFSKNETEKYGTIEIKNMFGLGSTLATYTLLDNSEKCLYSCSAEGRAVIQSPDVLFRNIRSLGGRTSNISVFLQDGVEQVRVNDVKIVETCRNENLNGTVTRVCSQREIVTPKTEVRKKWVPYNGAVLQQGAYSWRIEANKLNKVNTDWVANAYGINFDEWAFWIGVSPIAYWKFNEVSGQANDSIGNHNLTNSSSSNLFIPGKLNNSVRVAGNTNLAFTTGASNDFAFSTGNFSIAYWWNSSAEGSATATIGSITTGWNICRSCTSTTSQTFRLGGTGILSTDNIQNSSYHRIVWVREGTGAGELKLYIDGTLNKTGTSADDLTDAGSPINILNGGGSTTDIVIDDLQIFKGFAWNSGDVLADFNNGTGREAGDPIPQTGIFVQLNSPDNGVILISSNITFNGTVSPFLGNITNVSLYVWNATNSLVFNSYNTTINSNEPVNVTFNMNFTTGSYSWNYLAGGKNVTGSAVNSTYAAFNFTFSIGIAPLISTWNNNTYETSSENFSSSISALTGSISSASLIWDSNSYSATATSLGSDLYTLSRTIDIPLGSGTKQWHWQINLTSGFQQNLPNNNQVVGNINFSICGPPTSSQNTSYLNFSFKDENNLSVINAKADASTWFYWLGNGAVNKTYVFQNPNANANYTFCFTPQNKTVNTNFFFKYSNTGYPQRTYQPDTLSLTNATTQQILYLLSTADGIYSSIQVVDAQSLAPIPGANVVAERLINNLYVVIETGTTDSSGLVTFWVNPNYDHRITVSKDGYANKQVIIRPSQSVYTIALGSTTSGNASYASDLEGIKWFFYPGIQTLNTQSTKFGLNLTASKLNLDGGFCKFDLINAKTDAILSSTTGGSSGGCNLTITYTPQRGQILFGRFSIDTTNTTGFVIIDTDAKWVILDKNNTNTIITSIFDDLKDLSEFGGDDSNRAEFTKFVIFFFLGTILLAMMTFFTGWEINNPVAAVLIIWGMVLIASVGGFFNFNYGSDNISATMSKYGILFIYSLFAGGYMINQWRKTE